jgi:hypothetical protein
VGTHDGADVSWEIVDGAPASPVTNDPDGWRGGVSAAGDDVGRWTSIAVAGATVYVSYYDRTNGALKMAIGAPGDWAVHVVDDTVDSGRYSSLVIDGSGHPVVAYMRQGERSPSTPGLLKGAVIVASANGVTPSSAADWSTVEVASADMSCRPQFCMPGQVCYAAEGVCTAPTADCSPACPADTACLNGKCSGILPDGFVEDMPVGIGLYASLARTSSGLALVFYDRTSGNLWGARHAGGAWGSPFVVDGYAKTDPEVGDCGIGASLFVDAGDVWHVTYVDGTEESLRYARVDWPTVTTELVDDGSSDGAGMHTDGRHIVGDDSSIAMLPDGALRVVYQDATSQRAMAATRATPTGAWGVSVLDAVDPTGFWIEQALDPSGAPHTALLWQTPAASGVRVAPPL